ncbi:MAG: hypothetical protein RR313_12085 [Anaerovoracaceae bacterium]
MAETDERAEAIWTYEISIEKILKRLVVWHCRMQASESEEAT